MNTLERDSKVPNKDIIVLGGARDYHAMDWYRSVRKVAYDRNVYFLTDMISGEGFDNIIRNDDVVHKVFIIDKLLFSSQSYLGHLWRNILKLLILPIQIVFLKRYISSHPYSIVHAHPMYYMLLCQLSGIEYIGTPQGSEILVRPARSKLYRFFSTWLLKSAKSITVDSKQMAEKIRDMSAVKAHIVQNGINMTAVSAIDTTGIRNEAVVSIRGMTDLYRIETIIEGRDWSQTKPNIIFMYPFFDDKYLGSFRSKLQSGDQLVGRLDRDTMYRLLVKTKLVVSIPSSDSSPRSVYEAIFLGCCVASTYNPWMDSLPECMKGRIIEVNLNEKYWLKNALNLVDEIVSQPFIPSKVAVDIFDEDKTMSRLMKTIYA